MMRFTVVARTQRGRLMKFVPRNSFVIILLAGLLCQRGPVGAQMQQADDHSYMDIDESGGGAGAPAEIHKGRGIGAGPRPVTTPPPPVPPERPGRGKIPARGTKAHSRPPGKPQLLCRA